MLPAHCTQIKRTRFTYGSVKVHSCMGLFCPVFEIFCLHTTCLDYSHGFTNLQAFISNNTKFSIFCSQMSSNINTLFQSFMSMNKIVFSNDISLQNIAKVNCNPY